MLAGRALKVHVMEENVDYFSSGVLNHSHNLVIYHLQVTLFEFYLQKAPLFYEQLFLHLIRELMIKIKLCMDGNKTYVLASFLCIYTVLTGIFVHSVYYFFHLFIR